jgi:hypothetical protein
MDQEEYGMSLTDMIEQYVEKLPPSFQSEVLDYVKYLLTKADQESMRNEDKDFSNLSLSLAMRGMEKDNDPIYAASDLKATF